MTVANFNGNPRATIFSCYSPTNISEKTERIAFYNELSPLVRNIPKHNVLVISGDMNAQIGKNGNHKYSLHNSSNKNGQHLTDFTIENRLTCLNTNFQKREGKLRTYTYANNTKAQLDFVFINKKWKNNAVIARLTPLSRVCPPITELSRQKYDWAYERMPPEQRPPYTMNGPFLIRRILEINNSMNYKRRQKHVPRKTNMRISSTPTEKQQRNTYRQNIELNLESHGKH